MNKQAYSDKLKDPRWQKKRLEIFQRDDWQCQLCFSREHTLVVHHRWYESGYEPWDYPDDCLVTLCENCHEQATSDMAKADEYLALIRRNLWGTDIQELGKGIACSGPLDYEELSLSLACWILRRPDLFHAINDALVAAGLKD
jgi:hypothetical protein